MTRALNLNLTEAYVADLCDQLDVRISTVEKLASGGIRLVCDSASGAALLRHRLRGKLIEGPVERSRIFSRGMQPYSSRMSPGDDRAPRSFVDRTKRR